MFGSSDALNGQQEASDYISSLHGFIPRPFHTHLYTLLHLILQKAGIYVHRNSNMTIVSIDFLIQGTWVPSTVVSLSTIYYHNLSFSICKKKKNRIRLKKIRLLPAPKFCADPLSVVQRPPY